MDKPKPKPKHIRENTDPDLVGYIIAPDDNETGKPGFVVELRKPHVLTDEEKKRELPLPPMPERRGKGWDSRKTDVHLWYLLIIAILLWIIFHS